MSHRLFEERLGPWLDGELAESASREVADHVRDCTACRSRMEEMRRLSAAIRGIDRHPMPAELKATLIAESAGRPGSRMGSVGPRVSYRLLGSVAAAAGIVLAVIALRTGQEADKPVIDRPVEIAMSPPVKDSKEVAPETIASKESPAKPVATPAPPRRKVRAARPEPARDTSTVDEGAAAPPIAAAPAAAAEATAGNERTADELKTLPVPAAPVARNVAARQALTSTVSRYQTQLIETGTQPPVLGPIVPADSSAGPGAGAGPVPTPLSKEKSAGSTAGMTRSSVSLSDQETVRTKMTFLVQVDRTGRVLTVDPVGALVMAPERVRMVKDLLAASTLPPRAAGEPMLVVIEVLVTGE